MPGVVAHACNPSTLGGRDRRIPVRGQPQLSLSLSLSLSPLLSSPLLSPPLLSLSLSLLSLSLSLSLYLV